ncbi:putative f-box domain protein [Diplodia seriata]|uniref:Putative f-box domain protein n=1 Tax=Diplodia seriata TaxID=420778 RepID=A0A0G2HKV0_9PEZI|nr:putative f-box domain protein [Diplodia seriata]
MASATLPALPTELLHLVVSSLRFADLLALRFVCHSLAAKVSSDKRFERRFAARTSDLSTKSLETLAAIVAHPIFGTLVRQVTLVTSFLDADTLLEVVRTGKKPPPQLPERASSVRRDDLGPEELAVTRELLGVYEALRTDRAQSSVSGRDVELLAAVFARLGALRTLRLEASVFKCRGEPRGKEQRLHVLRAPDYLPKASVLRLVDAEGGEGSQFRIDDADGEWHGRRQKTPRRQIWEMAVHDFNIALRAMAQSGIAIDSMLVFGKEWGCSVLSAEVGKLLADDATSGAEVARAAVSCLKSLSISVSRGSLKMFGGDGEKNTVDWDGIDSNEDIEGFGDLLAMASSLEKLDMRKVRMYNELGLSRSVTDPNFFRSIATKAAVTKLRSLTLRGWTARGDDLSHLLWRCSSLEELELREVRLWDGQWSQVFGLLAEQTRQLKQVTLYRCFETQLIRITRPEGATVESDNSCCEFMDTVKLSGEQVRDGIEYCKQAETWTGSRPHRVYQRERMKEYGF